MLYLRVWSQAEALASVRLCLHAHGFASLLAYRMHIPPCTLSMLCGHHFTSTSLLISLIVARTIVLVSLACQGYGPPQDTSVPQSCYVMHGVTLGCMARPLFHAGPAGTPEGSVQLEAVVASDKGMAPSNAIQQQKQQASGVMSILQEVAEGSAGGTPGETGGSRSGSGDDLQSLKLMSADMTQAMYQAMDDKRSRLPARTGSMDAPLLTATTATGAAPAAAEAAKDLQFVSVDAGQADAAWKREAEE